MHIMAALQHTKQLSITSNANFMYDFVLMVETNDNDPVISIAIEDNGNDLDSYTLANWPALAPKRIGNILIYKLDFWFSNELTPFHDTSDVKHRFIRIVSTGDYPMTLTNSGKQNTGTLDQYVKYVVNTHAEIKINPNYLYPIELRHVIGTFTIYCKDGIDKILSIVTNDYTYDINTEEKTKYLTLSVTAPEHASTNAQYINRYLVKVIFVNARHAISISYYQYNVALNINGVLAMKYSRQVAYKSL